MSDENKVLSMAPFLEERRGYRCGKSFVHTGPFVIDETLNVVECGGCKKDLNPIKVLLMMCQDENRWRAFHQTYREQKKEIESKIRAKCQHCGKFTRLGIRGLA